MVTSTGNFAELLWPGIRKLFGQTYDDWEELFTKIFDVVSSDKAFEKYQGVTGLPLAQPKSVGKSIEYRDPAQGFQKEMINTTFALGASITYEMYQDDQYQYINSIPKMLARSARITRETLAFNVINRATDSGFTGADGQPLASQTHLLVKGGTFSNMLATNSDLNQTTFETMITTIMNAVDDDNLAIKLMPKVLLTSTTDAIRAEKILTSDLVTGSADNDKNVVRGKCTLVVSPYLTDTDAWGVTTNVPSETGLIWQEREGVKFERDNEFKTKNLDSQMYWRSDVSWVDPRCLYYTPGA